MTGSNLLKSPKKAALPKAERDAKILQLRALGAPLQAIADRLDCGERTVRRVVERRLSELQQTTMLNARAIVSQHLLELEGLRGRLAGPLASNDYGHRLSAIRTFLALQEREARLLGLDRPARVEVAAESAAAETLLAHLASRLPAETVEAVIDVLATDVQLSA